MNSINNYLLKTKQGLELNLLNFGARIHSLTIPINGKKTNLVLGYQNLQDYLNDAYYLGATVGRFCNRIHGGELSINEQKFKLPLNEIGKSNTLHGGPKGFDKCFWKLLEISEFSIEFQLISPHLDQGFPGNLEVRARYEVENLGFTVEYIAKSDQDTIINLCNHTYFNLDGVKAGELANIKDHELRLYLTEYLPLNQNNVPNGNIQNVIDSPFDFANKNNKRRKISTLLNSEHPQISLTGGLDHTFITQNKVSVLQKVAQLYSTKTNIELEVSTNQIATHVYSGNYLDNQFGKNAGICFETQAYPDSPNHAHFPSAILKKGETYHHKTTYQFQLS